MPRAGTITLHTSITLLAELAEIIGRGKFVRPICAQASPPPPSLRTTSAWPCSSNQRSSPRRSAAIRTMITCSPPRSAPMRS